MDRQNYYQPRQDGNRPFGNVFAPPYSGGFRESSYRPNMMYRPRGGHSNFNHRGQFRPPQSRVPYYKERFFSPPRGTQTLHENRRGDFTPPRPYQEFNRGGANNRQRRPWKRHNHADSSKVNCQRVEKIFPINSMKFCLFAKSVGKDFFMSPRA